MQRKIPVPVRTAIVSCLVDLGLRENGLATEFLQREGFGSFRM